MSISKAWVRLVVIGLLAAQTILIVCALNRESLTFDEPDHMYAGYRMWTTGDYGLNPEHPPLVKLLATLPVLHEKLWTPPLRGVYFKSEAAESGRQWIVHLSGSRESAGENRQSAADGQTQ